MNKKGQALVEFIIVMPIFILILLAAFDWVKVIQVKMNLESALDEIVFNESYSLDKDMVLKKEIENDMTIYKITTNVKLSSPFVTFVVDNPYKVVVERAIYE